jgi:hypothetical protein
MDTHRIAVCKDCIARWIETIQIAQWDAGGDNSLPYVTAGCNVDLLRVSISYDAHGYIRLRNLRWLASREEQ